jgi:integrase
MLRAHLERFPNTTRYVFRGPRGGAISDSAYLPYFHRARAEAFTPTEAASPLAAVPYSLRHAAVSTWLNAGVPGTQIAEWAGHSVEVLYRVYAKCIAGQDAEAKRRILEATSPGTDESAEDVEDGEELDEESPDGP